MVNNEEIKINKWKIADILQARLIDYLAENLSIIEAIVNIEHRKVENAKIEYFIKLSPKNYNLIKDELDHAMHFVVDGLDSLESGYIKKCDNCFLIIFK